MLRLRGNSPATVDEKGRLKLPSSFKAELETFAQGEGAQALRDGGALRHYLTSLDGRSARLYPMPVWEAIEARLANLPSTSPAKRKFLETTAYFGSEVEPDAQGRFVIPPILREAAQLTGEVAVLGQMDHLALWNKAGFERRLAAEPLGAEDLAQLADLGI
ncbi:division/cell wall cluster transcriptional repressor MraZ [Geothrix oryzisoli]|uniref:division/cell wall cluster transcriptional repressor MraZ n=1 Tax=Geothrix oryzisoli TaxID=2922721 RepID=UPI001FAD9BA3